MLKKFLKEIIVLIAGKPAEGLADILDGKKYINEFLIAKKLDLTINQTRNILYKISDRGLVSFIRKKDKRKGWYTYFWKLEILKCLEFLKADLINKIDQTNHKIKSRETKEFYVCKTCNIEFNEENALVHDFMCNECGEIMNRKDNIPVLKEYSRKIDRLRRELAAVENELDIEKTKTEKTKLRALKKKEKTKTKKPSSKTKKKPTKPKKTKVNQIKKKTIKKSKKKSNDSLKKISKKTKSKKSKKK